MNELHGTIQGGEIKLDGKPLLPGGAQVEVRIMPTGPRDQQAARERITACTGLQEWSEADDRILAELEADRRRPFRQHDAEHDPFA